jgi:hypothetical protein
VAPIFAEGFHIGLNGFFALQKDEANGAAWNPG